MTLYNEIDPFACDWLQNLVDAGHIADGIVDRRSIKQIEPWMLEDEKQAHFFAGIGVWSHALRLAGWPDEVGVWSGSCPCQGWSQAGRRKGFDDERHLWPAWFKLIKACRPPIIFGEQVASADVVGKVRPSAEEKNQRTWIELVQKDLEEAGYEFGFTVLGAGAVGAPHIRQRLYFVAVAHGKRRKRLRVQLRKWAARSAVSETRGRGTAGGLAVTDSRKRGGLSETARRDEQHGTKARRQEGDSGTSHDRGVVGLANGACSGREKGRDASRAAGEGRARSADVRELGALANGAVERRQSRRRLREARDEDEEKQPRRLRDARELGDTSRRRSERDAGAVHRAETQSAEIRIEARHLADVAQFAGATRGFWADADWLFCQDGKWRPALSETLVLAHGPPRRMDRSGTVEEVSRAGLLKGLGNAIVAPLAATFIETVMGWLLDEDD